MYTLSDLIWTRSCSLSLALSQPSLSAFSLSPHSHLFEASLNFYRQFAINEEQSVVFALCQRFTIAKEFLFTI